MAVNLNPRSWGRLTWILLGTAALALIVVVFLGWLFVTSSGQNVLASLNLTGNTNPSSDVDLGGYPPPAETEVVTEEPVAEILPTATALPTLEPVMTEAPTEEAPVVPTDLPAPTSVPPTPAPEIKTYTDLMELELDKLSISPVNPHGLDPAVPYEIKVAPGSYAQVFVGEGRVTTPDGQTLDLEPSLIVNGVVQKARENVLRFYNPTDTVQTYLLAGFPRDGFSVFPAYYPGMVPASELMLTGAIGNPTHCGMDRGCDEGWVHDFVYDGTATVITSHFFDLPANLEKVFSDPVYMEWMTMNAQLALDTILENNLSQPPEVVYVNTMDGILYIGVTKGKDQAVYVPEGVTIVGPDGTEVPVNKLGIAFLRNSEPNTAEYQIHGLGRRGVVRWEFKYGTDSWTMAEFLASQLFSQTDAQRFGFIVADGVDVVEGSVVYLVNFSGDATSSTENNYSEPAE